MNIAESDIGIETDESNEREVEVDILYDETRVGRLSGESDEETDTDSLDYDYDSEILDAYEKQLSDAQREWERSLEQLWQMTNWVILPLVGKLLGRRTATIIWKRFMGWFYS